MGLVISEPRSKVFWQLEPLGLLEALIPTSAGAANARDRTRGRWAGRGAEVRLASLRVDGDGERGFKMRDGGLEGPREWAASHSFATMLTFCPLDMLVRMIRSPLLTGMCVRLGNQERVRLLFGPGMWFLEVELKTHWTIAISGRSYVFPEVQPL